MTRSCSRVDGVRVTQRIAVVSDGSALNHHDDIDAVLRHKAELLSGLVRLPVRPTVIPAEDAPGLAAGIRALPSDIGAVLLARVAPQRAGAVQSLLREGGSRPLLIEQDITAIALAATTLAALRQAGRPAVSSRVVLAGTHELPILPVLLMAAGVGDITMWNPADAAVFPLHDIVFGADVVVDLVHGLPPRAANRRGGVTVIHACDTPSAPYAAASLLQAAVGVPGLEFDTETYSACALALATLPASDGLTSYLKGIALTCLVADAVTDAVRDLPARRANGWT